MPVPSQLAFTPYVFPLLTAALIAAGIGIYTWRKRHVHASAVTLTWLMCNVFLWLLAYSMRILSAELRAKEFWEIVITCSQAFVGPIWLVFALQYAGRSGMLTPRRTLAILSPGIITAALALTNSWHHLLWSELNLVDSWPLPSVYPIPGPWYWVLALYRYLYVLIGTILVLVPLARSPAWNRSQGLLVALGGLMPLVGNALHIFDLTRVFVWDLGPFGFVLGGLLLSLGLFTFRLLDILPVAQQAIFQSMQDGVLVLDGAGRLVDINPAGRLMLGIPARQPAARIQLDALLPASLCSASGNAPGEAHEFLFGRGEAARWLRPEFYPLVEEQGRVLGQLLVLYDITREHQLAELRDDLTHMMVHDLRNPLTIMYCSAELLLDEALDQLDPRSQKLLKMIMSSNIQSLELVNHILDLQSLESGHMELEQEDIDVKAAVQQAIQQASLLAEMKQQALQAEVPDGLPAALADPRLLQRILQNLIGNAIKFTPEGGAIRISAQQQGDYIKMEVADTGPGIAPELQQRLFEKYVTGGQKQRGSGLGLAFCRLAVEAHGGTIGVESQKGQGSTFSFTLPIASAKANPQAKLASTRQDVS